MSIEVDDLMEGDEIISEVGSSSGLKKVRKLSDKRREEFYYNLHTLSEAELDIESSLLLLAEEKGSISELYLRLRNLILDGSSFSMAMESTGLFSDYEINSIHIGEESGRTTIVLDNLYEYFKGKNELRRQMVSMLTYPSIMIVISIGVVYFLMTFIVPTVAGVFERMQSGLPPITEFMLSLSRAFETYVPWILYPSMLVFLFFFLSRKTPWFKKGSAQFILRMPVFGELFRRIYLARLTESLSLLIASQVPLERAFELVSTMITFYPIQKTLEPIREKLIEGSTLSDCFAQYKIYDNRFVAMVKVGEEVNRLEKMMDNLSQSYANSVDYQSKLLKSLMEPIVIIFVGAVVALVAMALVLPIFQMTANADFG